jgi:hypothetical protein
MFAAIRLRRLLTRSLLRRAACLAVVGQLAVLLGSVADERDGAGMQSHVEQAGTSAHYAHGDICGLCQARSLHGVSVTALKLRSTGPLCDEPNAAVGTLAVSFDLFAPTASRAPPRLG